MNSYPRYVTFLGDQREKLLRTITIQETIFFFGIFVLAKTLQ